MSVMVWSVIKDNVLSTVMMGWCSIVETFPEVNLFFDGGAVMNLGPKNYLFQEQLSVSFTISTLISLQFYRVLDVV